MLAQPEYCVFAKAFMPGIKPSFTLRACIAGLGETGFAVTCTSKDACRNAIASASSTMVDVFVPLVVRAIVSRQLCLGVAKMYRRESLNARVGWITAASPLQKHFRITGRCQKDEYRQCYVPKG